MIKNLKLNQHVFYIDDNEEIRKGKVSQIYSNPSSIGVDNFLYLDKKFLFSTRAKALKYLAVVGEIEYLISQRNFYEKQIQKFQKEYERLLK